MKYIKVNHCKYQTEKIIGKIFYNTLINININNN